MHLLPTMPLHTVTGNQPTKLLWTKKNWSHSRSKYNRGSVAASMAASGDIPKSAGMLNPKSSTSYACTGLKIFRKEEHAKEFSKGGRTRTFGRCCACTSCTVILIIIGLVAGFLLW